MSSRSLEICFNPRPSQPEGATARHRRRWSMRFCFNPRPSQPEGATSLGLYSCVGVCSFNPRPSQPEGATTWANSSARERPCFNPRPSQPEGATSYECHRQRRAKVSIHAPPNRKERPVAFAFLLRAFMFQSTPLPTGRSDYDPLADYLRGLVSIHAPPNRKERHSRFNCLLRVAWFQSTPLPTGRSDGSGTTSPGTAPCFNPRPSQPEGATARLVAQH